MDSKIKELERLVAADPSNYDAVARLYHFQKRMGSELDLFRKLDISDDITKEVHKYFGSKHFTIIYPWEDVGWFLDGRYIWFHAEHLMDYKNYKNSFREVILSKKEFMNRIKWKFLEEENSEWFRESVRKDGYVLVRSSGGTRLLRESNEVDLDKHWEQYKEENHG